MKNVVLVFVLHHGGTGPRIVLGRKKRGFGAGKVVAPGGKIEAGETPVQAAVRELEEETTLVCAPESMEFIGTVVFEFPQRAEWSMHTDVFLTSTFEGSLRETDELDPLWYPLDNLPIAQMWGDAEHWISQLITTPSQEFTVIMAEDNEAVAEVRSKQL